MTDHAPLARHVRITLPTELHRRVRRLSFDLNAPLSDVLLDAVLLLLRYHERAEGLHDVQTKPMPARAEESR